MSDEAGTTPAAAVRSGIVQTAIKVITTPAEFFRSMPKSGGFGDPLVFLVVMSFISGVIQAVLGLFKLVGFGSVGMSLASIVMTPVMALIFGFVGAGILFVIWKLMGSQESYETAYRCAAYTSALSPFTTLLQLVPFAGPLVSLAWMTVLLIAASVEVHRIAAKTARLVFCIIALVLAAMSISSQMAVRKMKKSFENMDIQAESTSGAESASGEDMTPEEAGKAAAAFMKGMGVDPKAMQDAIKKAQAEAEAEANRQAASESADQ